MILLATPKAVRGWRAVRFLMLLVVAMLIAHDAVYLARYGWGFGYEAAMRAGGHEGYWLPFTVLGIGSATALIAIAMRQTARLRAAARALPHGSVSPHAPALSYRAEFLALWRRLTPIVMLGFLIQENVELLLAGGAMPGLGPVLGLEAAIVLPVLASVCALIAAVGALVRWRQAHLRWQIRTAAVRSEDRGLAPDAIPVLWRSIAAICAKRWILARGDIGRAPPVTSAI